MQPQQQPQQHPSLFGAPPEQPQQANHASLFRDTPEHPLAGMDFFGTEPAPTMPQQPATSLQPQLLHRGHAGEPLAAAAATGGTIAQTVKGFLWEVDPPDVAPQKADGFEVSPVARTFVIMARLIATTPQLQLSVLRGL